VEDALLAAGAGADALGFIFYEKSPRFIAPKEARSIVAALPPFITPVGVFVDEEAGRVKEIAGEVGLFAVQLHGSETPTYCASLRISVIKAFRVRGPEDIPALGDYSSVVSALLLDAYKKGEMGGTGEVFDWDLAVRAREHAGGRPIILSGGLTPENVAAALLKVRPYAVDVSSGVETAPGKKDAEKVREFIRRAKEVR
jgi:phosphoribosylanthranilate isomerase